MQYTVHDPRYMQLPIGLRQPLVLSGMGEGGAQRIWWGRDAIQWVSAKQSK